MAGWDFPLTVESSRGIGGRDDPDNLLGGLATLPVDSHEEPEWGASSWADEPVEKDGTPPPAQPEREHRQVTAIEEASVAGVFEELLHPRDRAGKWAVKSVKGGDSTDHSAHLLSLKGAPDSLTLHSPNGQLTPEREALHRKIIKRALEGTTPQEHPRALFTAGGAASGKSSLIDQLEVPKGHVYVNPDTIKEQLPEYAKLKAAGHSDIAAAQMHEESSHIAAQIAAHALRTKRNVVIDGVGDSGSRKFVGKLARAGSHGHDVTVRYAHVSLEEALRREQVRREGPEKRAVPHHVLREAHLEVAKRYHDEVQHLHGVKVEVYDTNQPNRGAPKLIHHIRPTGEVETHDPAKYQEFLDKRHPPKTAIEEGEFEPSLHPRDRRGKFMAALREYTSGASRINSSLRGEGAPTAEVDSHVEALDAAIAESPPLDAPVTLYRGIRMSRNEKDLGKPGVPRYDQRNPGETMTDPGFLSGTTDLARAEGARGKVGQLLEIRVPAGTRVLDVEAARGRAANVPEHEMVLPRGTKLQKVADVGDRTVLAVAPTAATAPHLPAFPELPDAPISEPPLPDAKRISTGMVLKDGGKLWLFEPKGKYGGYSHTFPKGVLEPGLTPQQNAHKELHEETGLTGRITGHLGDYQGTTGVTRYYTAERTGGTPHGPDATPFAEGGRESAAVKLVTPEEAATMLNMPRDQQILRDLAPQTWTPTRGKSAKKYTREIFRHPPVEKPVGAMERNYGGPPEQVATRDLVPTQPLVHEKGLRAAKANPGDHPISGLRLPDGRVAVTEGHHGAAAAILDGAQTVPVLVGRDV